ncbi:MAG: hypothetical protein KGM98_09045, partial [Bacteroidota bacterium]|nr:hypothetical protein [Bacteroidota bacterium]
TIHGDKANESVSQKEVLEIMAKVNKGTLDHKPVHQINLARMEAALDKSDWVKKAELYFDNNQKLQASITEREPIARVFTTVGTSFYLDTSLRRLPLGNQFSANVPVFTNFPEPGRVFSSHDSLLASSVSILSQFIKSDPFWMAQIEQVNLTSDDGFDLVTKLGDEVVHFGTVDDMGEKFNNLLCFYKQVLAKYGWSKYSEINVEFKGQVVATRRGAQEIKADSVRSVEIMKALIANAQKQSDEDNNIQLSPQTEDNSSVNISKEVGNTPDENKLRISVTPPVHVPVKTKSGTEDYHGRTPSNHSQSIERPNPFPTKAGEKGKLTKAEAAKKIYRKPKAVMPPKKSH